MPHTGTNSSHDQGVRNPCNPTMIASHTADAVAIRKKARSTRVAVGRGCCMLSAKRRWCTSPVGVVIVATPLSP